MNGLLRNFDASSQGAEKLGNVRPGHVLLHTNSNRGLQANPTAATKMRRQECFDPENVEQCLGNIEEIIGNPGQILQAKRLSGPSGCDLLHRR